MKAISIRAPWWWFILHAGKDIENRPSEWKHRGPILVHASKWWKENEVYGDFKSAMRMWLLADPSRLLGTIPEWNELRFKMKALGGHVVGQADLYGSVRSSKSPWFNGPCGLLLRDAKTFAKPFPARGYLFPFEVPDELVREAA